MDKIYTIDIETNGLLGEMLDYSSFPYKLKSDAKLWCVVITDVKTKESKKAVKEEITYDWMKEALSDCKILIAHNAIKFDFLVLKLFGVLDYKVGYLTESDTLFGNKVKLIDTLILSRLSNPNRFGGHSLKVWGESLGSYKDDFRQQCIDAGIIDKSAPKGAEFKQWTPLMLDYCVKDTVVNVGVYLRLLKELSKGDWARAIKVEHKLADLAIRRESLGFWFDKDLAIKLVEDLTNKMEELENKVNPILPKKPMNKGELKEHTPPKTQVKKDGELSSYMKKFIYRTKGDAFKTGEDWFVKYGDVIHKLPFNRPVKTKTVGTIADLDHVKQTLIDDYGWVPSEWRERDLTKDSKKQSLPYEKRIAALERWYDETMAGKYKKLRLKELGIPPKKILPTLAKKLEEDFPVKVPTSPPIRVGVEKEICPNLIKLGEDVEFAKDFAMYLTYKHRKSSIAGGDIEDMDLDEDVPNTGFLSNYREVDGRIPTPSIEIGANTSRYVHISVANIPRTSSIYGKEMRSLFGAGDVGVQLGYDFSSLESRVMGHYVYSYDGGEELASAMVAEKPNDIHSVNSRKLGIPRGEVKSLTYALLYGANYKKLMKMLSLSDKDAKKLFDDYWDSVPALKNLKSKVESYWDKNGKKSVPSIDGRDINTRSKHSLLNAIFQSTGVIIAKYVNVLSMQYLEENSVKIDPFITQPSVCEMIAYHDECQLVINPSLLSFKTFKNKEDAENFKKGWGGNQLSDIGEGKNGYYVCLPNIVTECIDKAIKQTEKYLKLKVPLGYEWIVGRNWKDCH